MLRSIVISIALITQVAPSLASPNFEFSVALDYQNGTNGKVHNMELADKHFIVAAESGHPLAQYVAANIKLEQGSTIEAYAWLLAATKCGVSIPPQSTTLSDISVMLSEFELKSAIKKSKKYQEVCVRA